MNRPAFSRWAMESETPAMESFGDMLNKLKSFFTSDSKDSKPSDVTWKEKHEFVRKIQQFIKERYLNKAWVNEQQFKTDPIDIGVIGSVFELKGIHAVDVLTPADVSLKTLVKINAEFQKYFKIREAKQLKIYEKLQALERKIKDGQLVSETPEFQKIVEEYKALPFPFQQIQMEQYKLHGLEFEMKGHSCRVKFTNPKTSSHKVTPLTADDVLKFGTMLNHLFSSLAPYIEVSVPYDSPSDQHWDIDFKRGNDIWEQDPILAKFIVRLCWDGDIGEDREFFDGTHAHRKEGWAARGGLDVYEYDMAYALEKVITMSIK